MQISIEELDKLVDKKVQETLKSGGYVPKKQPYKCPVCGALGNRYMDCDYAGCADGRFDANAK